MVNKTTPFRVGLAWRMTLRDWRAGELRLLLLALLVSVAALSTVTFFTSRMRAAIDSEARQMLGADLAISADHPIPADWQAQAEARGLRTARTLTMASMVTPGADGDGDSKLVSLKGVSDNYPLHGELRLNSPVNTSMTAGPRAAKVFTSGTVALDQALAERLALKPGAALRVGGRVLRVAAGIASEPDRKPSMLNLAPRVMLALADLEAMELAGPGVRATWRLQVAGPDAAVQAFREQLVKEIGARKLIGVRIETVESYRAEMQGTLGRAESFLSLAGLLAAALAAVAIAIAARRFVLRHLDASAMLRCLGLRQGQLLQMYAIEMALLGVAGGALGALAGYASHGILLHWLGEFVPGGAAQLGGAGWRPAVQGIATGLVLLAGFALPQVLQLRGVSHMAVLRRERQAPRASALAASAVGLAAFTGLMLWQTGDAMLSLGVVLGLLVLAGLFALAAWLVITLLGRLRSASASPAWRFAITALRRRPAAAITQLVAVAIGLTVMLLLTVVQSDLLATWRRAAPADAPNHFVMNIQPDQVDDVMAQLGAIGPAKLHSSIRGRLLLVNGKPPHREGDKAAHEESLDNREWEASAVAAPPAWNQVTGGQWPAPGAQAEFSMDEGLQKAEGIKLGDHLTFDFGGEQLTAPVTSLRKIDWRSREENFALLLNEDAVRHLARTHTATLRVPDGQRAAIDRLPQRFPNLALFDVGYFLHQVEHLTEQLSAAVRFLSAFVCLAGLLVLYAALASSQDERQHQAALLRALGATRRTLQRAQWIEHVLSGALAGVLAAAGSSAASWLLAKFAFNLEWQASPLLWALAILAGALAAAFGGWLGLRTVLNQPPLQTLRQNHGV